MFPFELLSMPDRTFNSKGLLTYLAAKTRSGVLVACVAKTDQGEQIKGWSGSSEYNSMFVRSHQLPKPEKDHGLLFAYLRMVFSQLAIARLGLS